MSNSAKSNAMANAIRALAMDAVEAANSGHPGMPMGMADVATVLYSNHLKFSAQNPDWPTDAEHTPFQSPLPEDCGLEFDEFISGI